MIRQCAWCLTILGRRKPYADTAVTHTICKKCMSKMKKQVDEEYKRDMKKAS